MPATFCVPLRRSRSWPPPSMQRRELDALAHDEHADALRPAELVGADRDEVGAARTPRRRRATRTPAPRRCAAPRRGACSAHELGDLGERLDRADLVVDEHHRHDRRRASSSAAASASRSIDAVGVDAPRRGRPACSTGSSTAWCSMAEHTATPPRAAGTPSTARLSASVPPPVNTTSPGRRRAASATTSRASSSALRGVARGTVRARRVAEVLGEERQHRLDRLGPHRRASPRGRGRSAAGTLKGYGAASSTRRRETSVIGRRAAASDLRGPARAPARAGGGNGDCDGAGSATPSTGCAAGTPRRRTTRKSSSGMPGGGSWCTRRPIGRANLTRDHRSGRRA